MHLRILLRLQVKVGWSCKIFLKQKMLRMAFVIRQFICLVIYPPTKNDLFRIGSL